MFSLRPTAAQYPLKDKAEALGLNPNCFWFGYNCLAIFNDGNMLREGKTYAVPSGWDTRGYVKFTRFEVGRVTL